MNATLARNQDVVLVVDDSPETLSMLNDVLDRENLAVLVALEGAQAVTITRSITPDLILLDAMMPGMDGFETCRQLKQRQELAHVPIIFMTGLSDTESVVKGFEAGGVDYVTKPIRADELVARMRVHLANSRLTLSARTALDSAGQFLFSTDAEGQLLWSTPQTQSLLHKYGISGERVNDALAQTLAPCLREISREQRLTLNAGGKSLEVRLIDRTAPNEYLLRLIDPDRPADTDLLKAAFPLTEREAEVLLWICRGKTNREIGIILSLSPRTVNKHLEQVFKKLGVENRTTAAVMGLRYLEH